MWTLRVRRTWTLLLQRLWSSGAHLRPLLPMDRPSLRLFLLGTAAALAVGCTLITDVDRSKIPPPPVVEPDPVRDAGLEDAGTPPPNEEDAGAVSDAGADAATTDAGPGDAGSPDLADAQADGG